MVKSPNLAHRPFVNNRPVVRITTLLWVLSAVLMVVNMWVYWSFSQGQDEKRMQLAEVRSRIEAEQETLRDLEQRLSRVDLERENEQVVFLNRKIHERTFGWSVLFDTLTDIMPREVRLERLSPQSLVPRRRQRSQLEESQPGQEVQVGIAGEARSFEALLDFIDALYSSPAFENPDLIRETKERTGLIRFNLAVTYMPEKAGLPDAPSETPPEGPQPEEASPEVAGAGAEEVAHLAGLPGPDPRGRIR